MKIAYLFHHDAANPSVQSGRPASILQALRACNAEVAAVFPLATQPGRSTLPKKIGYRLLGKYYRGDREPAYLEAAAREFETRTEGVAYDFVFSPGSEMISRLRTTRPIMFCADATFANMVDYYWDFTRLSAEYIRKGHALEISALQRATLAVYPSQWAAQSAIKDYGADPAKVAVIPFGANLGKNNRRADVIDWIAQRPRDHIRLLFVGRHWERKGGELVIGTARRLIELGHAVVVNVVGCDVPALHRDLPWLKTHGMLSPRVPAEMERLHGLFTGAHYVFIPTRAEAYGLTFAEANAYGVPAIATMTGGVPGVITHGENGYLFPLSAGAADYAAVISCSFKDADGYRRLCTRSFDAFETRLNWRTFTDRFLALAAERLESARREGKPAAPVPRTFLPPRLPLLDMQA